MGTAIGALTTYVDPGQQWMTFRGAALSLESEVRQTTCTTAWHACVAHAGLHAGYYYSRSELNCSLFFADIRSVV